MTSRRRFLKTAIGATAILAGCKQNTITHFASTSRQRFEKNFDGIIVNRNQIEYEQWRRGMVWQMDVPERRPEYIVRPHTEKAVSKALEFASTNNSQVACKSGGHNIAASFLRESGVLIDLSEFNQIGEPIDNEIWIGPSVWSWHLAQKIEPLGYSFPYAHCATVSMGGYLLGGGVGINGDAWGGIGCHSVTAVKVMLANGDVVIADHEQNSDLFWAVRGAGTGFFGAVLAFKIRLYPRASDILEKIIAYPIEATAEVAAWQQKIVKECPKNIELLIVMSHRPPHLAGQTKADQKMCIARLAAFGENEGEATVALDKIANHQPPDGALFATPNQPLSMNDVLVGSIDPNLRRGFGRYSVDTMWTNILPDTLDSLVEPMIETPSVNAHVLASPRHGAELKSGAAFSSLADSFVGIYDIWDNPRDDAANVDWTQNTSKIMSPYAAGRYINEIDGFAYPDKIADCFSDKSFKKLAELRAHYDENRSFHGFPGSEV